MGQQDNVNASEDPWDMDTGNPSPGLSMGPAPRHRAAWVIHAWTSALKPILFGLLDFSGNYWRQRAQHRNIQCSATESGESNQSVQQDHDTTDSNVRRAEDLEDEGYHLAVQFAIMGHRLANEMGYILSPIDPDTWDGLRTQYRNYLDAQTFLFKLFPALMSMQTMQEFVVIAGRYLYGTQQNDPCPDTRYLPAVLRWSPNCLDHQGEPYPAVDRTNFMQALKLYEPAQNDAVADQDAVQEEEAAQPAEPVVEEDSSSLHLVRQLHEPSDRIDGRWIDAVNNAKKRGFDVAIPRFWTLSKNGKRELPVADFQKSLQTWRSALDADFPHFKEVTRYFYGQLLIAAENEYPTPSLAPVLLLGEPGIGKTTYVRHLAWNLGIPFAMQSMANTSGGFVLSGADPGWKNSKPGWIARTFLDMHTANPILMLDEIDKAASSTGGSNYTNVQETLLSILERETSARFVDEYLPHLQIDLSMISFVATANDQSGLSSPLLSRFQVMDIPTPSRNERRDIIQDIYRRMVRDLGMELRFPTSMSDDMVDALVNKSAGKGNLRDIHGILRMALGNAMIRSAHEDAQIALCPKDITDPRPSRSMGFL